MQKELKFPAGFLWGAATSSHQVEGGNYNDWTEWEKASAKQLAQDAAGKWDEWQKEKFPGMFRPENYISGAACDHYHRFRDDYDMAKNLGQNAHRFSIEWSRIEPVEGRWDEVEIEHYREVLKALRERGLEPFVTLWHWTIPLWIRDKGGWEHKETIKYFLRYAEKIVDELGSEIKFWIPLNEPTVYVGMSYTIGAFPPCVKSFVRSGKVLKHLNEAHRQAYESIHAKLGEKAQVGSSYNLHFNLPKRAESLIDRLVVRLVGYIRDFRPVVVSIKHSDFIGLNYYFRDYFKFVGWGGKFGIIDLDNTGKNNDQTDLGWQVCPEGIYHILKKLRTLDKPIYVTENGLADERDEKRERFIAEHLKNVHRAISEGVDVRGYFYWSLLDNFEWDKGWWPRFGLCAFDPVTQVRTIRPSALKYAETCRNNYLEIKSRD